MRKLLVVAIVIGLFVAGDAWVRAKAEQRVATVLQSSFDDSGEAHISFGGFPFIARVMAGSIPVANVTSSSLVRDGIRLTDVRMTLTDVSFSWSKVLSGEIGSVTVRDGHGRAALGRSGLIKAFEGAAASVDVRLEGGRLTATVGPVNGSAHLGIEGTDLVLRVLGHSIKIGLPRFIHGLSYRSVRVGTDGVVIEFSLADATFNSP